MKQNKGEQIEGYLLNYIKDNNLSPGDRLVSERELCEKFSASKMTVSKAISRLVLIGKIKTVRGSGIFVGEKALEKEINKLTSFTDDLKALGKSPKTKIVEFVVSAINHEKQKKCLGLDNEDLVYILKRLRYDSEKPIAYDVAYINPKVIPNIDINEMGESFYEYIKKEYDIKIYYADQEVTCIAASDHIADLLCISPGEPVILTKHSTYTEKEECFEYVYTYYSAESYVLKYKAYY